MFSRTVLGPCGTTAVVDRRNGVTTSSISACSWGSFPCPATVTSVEGFA